MAIRAETILSICSGIGGIELGLRSCIKARTVCYVENEISVATILATLINQGAIDDAPIWSDLKTFDPSPWRDKISFVTGGIPCPPWSAAGKHGGKEDERNLYPTLERIIDGLRTPVLFLENVPGIKRYFFETIRPNLQGMGYQVEAGLYSAAETGAPHKRQRLFILAQPEGHVFQLANPKRKRTQIPTPRQFTTEQRINGTGSTVQPALYPPPPEDHDCWSRLFASLPEATPCFCRETDGLPSGLDVRIRAIGNAVVPAVARVAFRDLSRRLNFEMKGGD